MQSKNKDVTSAETSAKEPLPLDFPFELLPAIGPGMLRAIEAAAMEANERYLIEFIEEHSFCPFSRGGRVQGQTARFVHYCNNGDVAPLFDRMARAAVEQSLVVVQVIFPLVEVAPEDWIIFCRNITTALNAFLGGDAEVYAVAPLHPDLAYKTSNPFAMIPLFRRSPDPTIQWVRLDGLDGLYAGRSADTIMVDIKDVAAFLKKKHKPPLFNRIAESNMSMANRLGIERVEESLAEISRTVRRRYMNILLNDDDRPEVEQPAVTGCPCHGGEGSQRPSENVLSAAVAPPPLVAELLGESWSLTTLRSLSQREPRHVVVDGVDLVVVRVGNEVHALYGRCPHRLALLSDAILEGKTLICKHHGWDFQLETGCSEGVPGESVHRFRTWIDEGRVCIEDAELKRWRAEHPEVFSLGELIP